MIWPVSQPASVASTLVAAPHRNGQSAQSHNALERLRPGKASWIYKKKPPAG
jgi:hypothetical protein